MRQLPFLGYSCLNSKQASSTLQEEILNIPTNFEIGKPGS